MILLAVYALILVVSVLLTAQSVFTLGLMLYTWARPERLEESGSPDEYLPPSLSFTAILPARNEEGVIGHTVRQVWESDYPKDLLEVVVVCEASDVGTIEEAEAAAAEIGHPGVRVVAFDAGEGPVNKPRGLNVAFEETSNEVVTIFDAEDDVHPEIFDVINTTMQQKDASIVQAGVQLMDFRSSWYSTQNVLEYFFYFKSRLHYHARVGMIPLGGNTVFIKRALIERVGGWDEACLTEDADVGIRLSVQGEKIAVTYDARHATREETPDSLVGFVKQRTRWCQGFFQVFRKGDWRKLPTRGQRLLAAYSMTYPYFQAFVGALWLPAFAMILYLRVPVWLAILSLLPLYAIAFQFLVSLVGFFDFARAYGFRLGVRDLARFALGFLPYQLLLSISALRAVFREFRGATNWEKTAHSGAHRTPAETKTVRGGAAHPAGDKAAVPAVESVGREAPGAARPLGGERTGPSRAPDARPNEVAFRVGLHALLSDAVDYLGADGGSVMVRNPEDGAFYAKASRGLPGDVARSAEVGPGEQSAGQLAHIRRPMIRLNRQGLASSIVLPIERDGDVAAVISLSSKEKRFGREDLDWLSSRARDLPAKRPDVPAA